MNLDKYRYYTDITYTDYILTLHFTGRRTKRCICSIRDRRLWNLLYHVHGSEELKCFNWVKYFNKGSVYSKLINFKQLAEIQQGLLKLSTKKIKIFK